MEIEEDRLERVLRDLSKKWKTIQWHMECNSELGEFLTVEVHQDHHVHAKANLCNRFKNRLVYQKGNSARFKIDASEDKQMLVLFEFPKCLETGKIIFSIVVTVPKGKNWRHLDPALQKKCISFMNLRTRARLRKTCRAARNMVDSQKYEFEQVLIADHSETDMRFSCNISTKVWEPLHVDYQSGETSDQIARRLVQLIAFVMKVGIIHRFDYTRVHNTVVSNQISDRLFEEMKNSVPFHIICHEGTYSSDPYVEFLLKNSEPVIEHMEFSAERKSDFSVDKFIHLPAFIQIKQLKMFFLLNTDAAIKVIQMHIDNDVPVGVRFYFSVCSKNNMPKLMRRFMHRKIARNNGMIRLKTDNSRKHIVVYKTCLQTFVDGPIEYFSSLVVPSYLVEDSGISS